jgi:hypothetical protein
MTPLRLKGQIGSMLMNAPQNYYSLLSFTGLKFSVRLTTKFILSRLGLVSARAGTWSSWNAWGTVLLAAESLGWLTNPTCLAGAHAHDMRMDGTRDAVLHLGVQLG